MENKFKVGDVVTLSDSGISIYSADWPKYLIPYSMYKGDYGTVIKIEKDRGVYLGEK